MTADPDIPQQHAPRGPIKAKADPVSGPNPISGRCGAKAKHSGKPCKYPAIPGGTVCRFHGGGAPQVKAKALERLQAYQNQAIDRLFQLAEQTQFPSTAFAAVRDVLDRTMGKPTEQVNVNAQHSGGIEITWKDSESS